MTAVTKFLIPDNTSDDNFRFWGSNISQVLDSFGILKTNDKGQINWNSVYAPSGGNIYSGYELRHFTDPLQSIAPVFIKIRYGSYNYQFMPKIEINIGSGSDGSGRLYGPAITSVAGTDFYYETQFQIISPQTCVFSGSSSKLVIGFCPVVPQLGYYQVFAVERTKNDQGENTPEGVLFSAFAHGLKSNIFIPCLNTALAVPLAQEPGFAPSIRHYAYPYYYGLAYANTSADHGDRNNISVYPNCFFKNGKLMPPALNTLCYFCSDALPASFDSVPMYDNKLHVYFFTGNPLSGSANPLDGGTGRNGANNTCLALLYE